MCMICDNLDSMTTEQAISNIFEIKEQLGGEHTVDVISTVTDRMIADGTIDTIGKQHQTMFVAIVKFAYLKYNLPDF